MEWLRMPLLTTLAVMVILVHSEEIEKENHRISPRLADLGDSDYDQSWKAVESQLTMRPSLQSDDWEGTPFQEVPKRHRPGHKRYRRPQVPSDENQPILRPHFDDSPESYRDREIQSYETTNPPRRRIKKPNNWNNGQEVQRPLRKRGRRRKRPMSSTTTDIVPLEPIIQQSGQTPAEIYTQNIELNTKDFKHREHKDQMDDWFEREVDKAFGDFDKEFEHLPVAKEPELFESNTEPIKLTVKQESDVRHFSLEREKGSPYHTNAKLKKQGERKVLQKETPENGEIKEEIPFNSSPLKEILKRSGGSSLSELLQKKNLSLADLLSGRKNAIQVLQTETNVHSDENGKTTEKDDSEINAFTTDNESEKSETKIHETLSNNESSKTEPQQKTHIRSISSLLDYSSKPNKKVEYNNTNDNDRNENTLTTKVTINPDLVKTENVFKITSRKPFLPRISSRPKIRRPIRNNTTPKVYMKQIQSTPATQVKSTSTMIHIKESENIIETDTKNNIENISTTTDIYVDNDDEYTTTETSTVETTLDNTSPQSGIITSNQIPFTTTQTGKKTNMAQTEMYSTTEMANRNDVSKKFGTHTRPRLIVTNSELRKQILNNRLKRKGLRQKESNDGKEDGTVKKENIVNGFGSASESVTRTEKPHAHITTKTKSYVEATEISGDSTTTPETNAKADENLIADYTTIKSQPNMSKSPIKLTREDEAEREIKEILEDFETRKRLSKILAERNMTFKELVAHRERGSSQVHLADIFHNATHESSPPKSFLSKSSIEPISKEIYPLRVLLEANLHDTPMQTATSKTYDGQLPNIPIVMNFGNNVNENGEKLGMEPVINKFHNHSPIDKHGLKQDSEGGTYFTSVMSVNVSHDARESRRLKENSALDNLKKIISTMQNNFINKTQELKGTPEYKNKKGLLEQDRDGDGLIVLEDLEQFDESDKEIIRLEENFGLNRHSQTSESSSQYKDKSFSKAKSVTVVTSAVVALMMILFLLTYIGCKWQQKRSLLREKDRFSHGKINTPIFENRKSAKNSSTRSISPMLSTSNIYNMSTIDTRNGKESPEYMWDSMRKPFQ